MYRLEITMKINNIFDGFWNIFDEIAVQLKDKKVVLYGYGRSGYFIEQMLKLQYGIEIDYIVDNKLVLFGRPIDRICIFDYISSDETVVLLTMSDSKEVEKILGKIGYAKGINLFNLKELFLGADTRVGQIGLLEWLEKKYKLNFTRLIYAGEENKDAMNSSPTRQIGLKKVMNNLQINDNDALFDMGAGLGSALLLFRYYGFKKVKGIELFKDIYDSAQKNISLLGIDNIEIINADASTYTDLDDYNYFFFYNPFQGVTFEKAIKNIENSYKKERRKITIIYANPYCHKYIVKNQIFKLKEQIETDFDCRLVNIYVTNHS